MAAGIETFDFHLQPFDRGIDEARGGAAGGVFAQHVPRLERMAQFKGDAPMGDGAIERKTKFALRMEPVRIELIAGTAQIFQDAKEILPNEVPEHESVVQCAAPT